ncbi:HET domain-containing protein [Colletotrichum fioriniae PJ7]|uniref:HET domain-containing protein n=1 Tax=Colletotrichum fioriniae PJ7 TaxID=1445577 RepID=A0A010QCW7_9PEZI|nr:HET domain-containing protein [Colletotrichum fioriniae PJ7]
MRKIRRCRFHRWARSTGAPRRVYIWLGDVDADEVAIAFANIRMAQALSAATESYKTEVKLADRAVLHYGEHYIEYTRFRAAWYLVERCLLSQGNLGYLRHLLRRDVTDDLLELLWGFHTAKCSDPRDRLAALYGFLPQSEQPIALQYDQVGWKEMYRRLAERSINKGHSIGEPGYSTPFRVWIGCWKKPRRPPWVPNWSGVRQPGLASGDFLKDCLDSTDRGDKPWIDCSDTMGGLKTEGFGFLEIEKERLWKHVLSCLEPIEDELMGLESWLRVTTLFAIILRGKDVVSEDKDHLSRWSLRTLMDKMYEALRTGFENPESLAGEQILLLTLIGSVLQRFALVVLHPLPYIVYSEGRYDRPSWEQEYGLAPHDMEFGDILIPFDEMKPQNSRVHESSFVEPDI